MRPPIYLPEPQPVKIDSTTGLIIVFLVVISILTVPVLALIYFAKELRLMISPRARRKQQEHLAKIQEDLKNDPAYWIYTR